MGMNIPVNGSLKPGGSGGMNRDKHPLQKRVAFVWKLVPAES